MRSSVRARITAVATAIVAITMIVASWATLRIVESDLLVTTERALEAELELQAVQDFDDEFFIYEFEIGERDLGLGLFSIESEGIAFGELFEGNVLLGDVFIDLDNSQFIEVIDPRTGFGIDDPVLIAELQQAAVEFEEIADDDNRLLVGAAARDEVDESLDAVRSALFLIVPTLVAVMGGLIWLLVGRALRPVAAMSDRVEAISTSSLDQRVPVPEGRDAIANLANVMNGMLERLQRGDRRQRQFAADASHELRSPLSTVKAAAEMIEHNPAADRTQRLAGDIVAEADRMDRLIGDLLHLSRADEDRLSDDFEVVDVGLLAHDLGGGVEVIVETDHTTVLGSVDQLTRVIDNLVRNARRHADGRVRLSVHPIDDHWIRLAVEDDGPGVPPGDRERIFERFSRLDDARSRDKGGAGLGLALVKSIVGRHRGHVRVEDSPDLGGAAFVVLLPSARADR